MNETKLIQRFCRNQALAAIGVLLVGCASHRTGVASHIQFGALTTLPPAAQVLAASNGDIASAVGLGSRGSAWVRQIEQRGDDAWSEEPDLAFGSNSQETVDYNHVYYVATPSRMAVVYQGTTRAAGGVSQAMIGVGAGGGLAGMAGGTPFPLQDPDVIQGAAGGTNMLGAVGRLDHDFYRLYRRGLEDPSWSLVLVTTPAPLDFATSESLDMTGDGVPARLTLDHDDRVHLLIPCSRSGSAGVVYGRLDEADTLHPPSPVPSSQLTQLGSTLGLNLSKKPLAHTHFFAAAGHSAALSANSLSASELVLAFATHMKGGMDALMVAQSQDGGETWTKPYVAGKIKGQLGTLQIARAGANIVVLCQVSTDAGASPGRSACYDSADGGRSWSAPVWCAARMSTVVVTRRCVTLFSAPGETPQMSLGKPI